ncbi:MAG: 16S rRNA (cytidine(1402)-2'-O)-methyltransferase [Chloroflexi bacterium CFX4]|nr:16S rRNA (cytidine(1402)-2'-O)-methyltransferase [Chloroflexi bacterium CFX4]MDL1921858.1 16S rRNA (cytidine(1402)-2'-O)-methyltransferase [Chloroflexi bacterium CFX3]
MHTLYLIPTPIGNLEDITLRALRLLREVRLIAAEDTRHSRILLDHYQISTPMISYHEHNKLTRLENILEALTQGDVALISDAGTPTISDPGYELVRAALAAGVPVVPLPGANAAVTALTASGLPTDAFLYLGFPPRRPNKLRAFLKEYVGLRATLIFYESPNRLADTLHAMLEVFGDRQAVVALELTKFFEGFSRAPLSALINTFEAETPRGEVTLLVEGAPEIPDAIWDEARVRQALQQLLAEGVKRSTAAKQIAALAGWDRAEVYALDETADAESDI